MTDSIALRALRPDTDMPLLRHWLSKRHVSAWWGDPQQAFEEIERRADDAHAIIMFNGIDVGYICWEKPPRENLEEVGLGHLSDDLLDMDLLLGEESVMGKGVAPLAGRILLSRLRASDYSGCIGVATSVENVRAIRAAEKAGFQSIHEFTDPENGLCRYMILGSDGRQSERLLRGERSICAQQTVPADRREDAAPAER